MEMYQDGVEVLCLPGGSHCHEDELGRNPLDMDECPLGNAVCNGNCQYYEE